MIELTRIVSRENFIKRCIDGIYRIEDLNINLNEHSYVIAQRSKYFGVQVKASEKEFKKICMEIRDRLHEIYGDYYEFTLLPYGKRKWEIIATPIEYKKVTI